ncbi:hypothetical protein C8J57DRAFT_1063206 [Mycena rebaudengoi]|nr:hypothetical protein C8J57DRAFT_1063206 [Mycena rebaudengoi]
MRNQSQTNQFLTTATTTNRSWTQCTSLSTCLPPPVTIFSIPPELWSRIFIDCLSTTQCGPIEPLPLPSPKTAPLLLAQICTTWRAISIDTPELWSLISTHDWTTGAVETVQTWLARARNRPLTLSLDFHAAKLADRILALTLPLSGR